MDGVKRRPALLVAILVYVTLDLSLPAMPGAFVFEPGDSVESTQIGRGRASAESVALPAPARDTFVLFRLPLLIKNRLAPIRQAERRVRPVVSWRSWSSPASAPPSEDPH
jgi:hypothetical protein